MRMKLFGLVTTALLLTTGCGGGNSTPTVVDSTPEPTEQRDLTQSEELTEKQIVSEAEAPGKVNALTSAASNAPAQPATSSAPAQPTASNARTQSFVPMGSASTGEEVGLDMGSINVIDSQRANFTYQIGNDVISSQADCNSQSWTVLSTGQTNTPASEATQNMLQWVCQEVGGHQGEPISSAGNQASSNGATRTVFDPPSNVRTSPNGDVLCSVKQTSVINISDVDGPWYRTDYCGSPGWIHESQVQ